VTDYCQIGYHPVALSIISKYLDPVCAQNARKDSVIVLRSDKLSEVLLNSSQLCRIRERFITHLQRLHSSTFRRRVYKLCNVAVILQRYKDTFHKEPVLMK